MITLVVYNSMVKKFIAYKKVTSKGPIKFSLTMKDVEGFCYWAVWLSAGGPKEQDMSVSILALLHKN